MWYDGIDRNTFIKQIYTKVPELLNVRIDAISLKRDGTEVSVVFDMPVYPDNPPEKWNGNNTVSIEISFFVISEFKLEMKDRYMYGNIDIFSHESKIKNRCRWIDIMLFCSRSGCYPENERIHRYRNIN